MKLPLLALFAGATLFAGTLRAAEPLPECQPRGGLPNVFAKLAAGEEVRIAYLGGSITEAEGWRVLSRKWFAEQFPKAKVSEIKATISGTGAELGACRLERDALQFKPDLLFVEFAVNGAGNGPRRPIQSMEGIVRQTWLANPNTDICIVFTIGSWFLNDLQNDKLPYPMTLMDQVAAHYGIPTINLGLDVARKVKAGDLVYQGASSHADGKTVFSGDGVHPFLDTGHPLFLDAIVRSVPALKAGGKPGPHALIAPLDAANWENATLLPLEKVSREGDWKTVEPPGDAWGASVMKKEFPSLWKAEKAGSALVFKFRGTALGLAGLRGPDVGQFRVTVDELAPVTGTFFDHYTAEGQWRVQPWIYPGDLAAGEHRVRIELLPEPPDKAGILQKHGHAIKNPDAFRNNHLYVGGMLLAGELVP